MAVTVSFIESPPVVSLQGNPCVITATSSLTGVSGIYIHLCVQELVGSTWTDTDREDSLPLVDGSATFDISGYFSGEFTPGFMFPEHSSNLVLARPQMVKAYRVRIWESYLDGSGVFQNKEDESLQLPSTCYMLPGGISDDDYAVLNENSTNWWDEHVDSTRALNWMPGAKTVAPGSIEKLYWIQPSSGAGTLRFAWTATDGSTGNYDYAFTFAAYLVYEFSVSPALIEDLTGKEIASYTVSLVNTNFSQAYTVDRGYYPVSEHFLIANSFGNYEGLWCRGARTEEYTYERSTYERSDRANLRFSERMLGNIRGNFNRNNETVTGWLDTNWRYWAAELLNTDDAYFIRDLKLLPIVIDSDSLDVNDTFEDGPQSLSFEWKYSRTGKFASRMGIKAAYLFPPYYNKLSAFFQSLQGGKLLDRINGYEATLSGSDVVLPEITGNDIFDFSDATYWDQTLIAATAWYNAGAPRTCPLTWMVGATWAEAGTDTTHARLFHRDYGTRARDLLPILVYNQNLTAAEQQVVVDWLDWYATIWQDGSMITENDNPIVQ